MEKSVKLDFRLGVTGFLFVPCDGTEAVQVPFVVVSDLKKCIAG